MLTKVPNPTVNRTPGKLHLPVPSALRELVADYLERYGSHKMTKHQQSR